MLQIKFVSLQCQTIKKKQNNINIIKHLSIMGLDIYIHKVKRTRKNSNAVEVSDWRKIMGSQEEQDKKAFSKLYKSVMKHLKNVDADAYADEYKKWIRKLCKLINYPQFDLKDLGVSYCYETGEYRFTPVPLEKFEECFDEILKHYYGYYVGYFRKVNCVYRYFEGKLIDETAWVTKEDCEDIINRCTAVLETPSLASELMPTRSGCFFGSTEYDRYYFSDLKDVRKQFKSFIKYFKTDDDLMFIHMSW